MNKQNEDIRWIQRFDNYQRALAHLQSAVELATERELSDLEKQGLIQAFEFTHELAWKTLKDFFSNRGQEDIYGSKDATRRAVKFELIKNGDTWMDMIKSRNETVHAYSEERVNAIYHKVIEAYASEFEALKEKLTQESNKNQ